MEQYVGDSSSALPEPLKREVDAASRVYAAKQLGFGVLFLAMSAGVIAFWITEFAKGLDAITRFWIVLPLATIGAALYVLVMSLGLIVSSLPLFFVRARPGTTPEGTASQFYQGVLPHSRLVRPPYHRAWICLTEAARTEFGTLAEFGKYWDRSNDGHFTSTNWDVSVNAQPIVDDEAEVVVGLREKKRGEQHKTSEIAETARLQRVGEYWLVVSGRYPPQDKFLADLQKANEEVAREWTSCGKCKRPVRREQAEQTDGLCEVCFQKSRHTT